MKTLALILVLGFKGVASAGYNEAEAAAKYLGEHQMLDALLVKSGAALIGDAGTGALLTDNRAALELFRQAAEERNDGSLFGSRPEKLNSTTPMPKYGVKTKLFKLLLIDAKVKMAQRQRGPAEKDLLAAAGFLAQVSEQKSGLLMGSLVQQMCLLKSYPVLSDSLRGASADAAYLSELAARLGHRHTPAGATGRGAHHGTPTGRAA